MLFIEQLKELEVLQGMQRNKTHKTWHSERLSVQYECWYFKNHKSSFY